jgi:hypothetical protein
MNCWSDDKYNPTAGPPLLVYKPLKHESGTACVHRGRLGILYHHTYSCHHNCIVLYANKEEEAVIFDTCNITSSYVTAQYIVYEGWQPKNV